MHMTRSEIRRSVLRIASPSHRRKEKLFREIYDDLVSDSLLKIRDKYWVPNPGLGPAKFLDFSKYIYMATCRVVDLGLHTAKKMNLLDLGCGAGYYLGAARKFKHHVLGLDITDEPMYNDIIRCLGIERVEHRIVANAPLPDFGQKFDIITGFMIRFNNIGEEVPWGFEDWRWFLKDCKRHLKDGGRIYLSLNSGKRSDYRFLPDETAQRLRELPGLMVSKNKGVIMYH